MKKDTSFKTITKHPPSESSLAAAVERIAQLLRTQIKAAQSKKREPDFSSYSAEIDLCISSSTKEQKSQKNKKNLDISFFLSHSEHSDLTSISSPRRRQRNRSSTRITRRKQKMAHRGKGDHHEN